MGSHAYHNLAEDYKRLGKEQFEIFVLDEIEVKEGDVDEALDKYDVVLVHIEAPDEAGHNGDIKNKISAIEKIDSEIIGTILKHYQRHDDIRILARCIF